MLHYGSRPLSLGLPLFAWACVLASLNVLPGYNRAPAPAPPKTVIIDLGGDVKMEFVLIQKGKFTMGSPKDEKWRVPNEEPHEVEIPKSFYLAKYPVTQEQYQAIMKDNPSYFQAGEGGAVEVKDLDTKQFPVENVSWENAQAFCKKIQHQDKRSCQFRLPTEAEWEYACRAGSKTTYYFGDDPKNLSEYAWFKDNSEGRTHRVGEKKPNEWGLYDIHGNVEQWCEDYYATDEVGRRVLRGGSWYYREGLCRSASRDGYGSDRHNNHVGFRVAFRLVPCPD